MFEAFLQSFWSNLKSFLIFCFFLLLIHKHLYVFYGILNASKDIEIRLQNIFHRIKHKDNCYLYCHHWISNIKVFLFIFCIFCLLLFLIVLIINGFRLLLFIVNQLVFWIFCFWLFFWFQFKARLFLPENKFQYQGYYQY